MQVLAGLFRGVLNGTIALLGGIVGVVARAGVVRGWIHFPFLSQFLAVVPFSLGWKLRREIYARILPQVGRQAVVHAGVVIEDARTSIGDDVWISVGCYVDYAIIQDHVLIGPHAVILAGGRHHRWDRVDVPIKQQGNPPKAPVVLEHGCWIGANATVMAEVGHDAVVGAGSVVTRPVPPFAVVAGNPARVLRMRDAHSPTKNGAPAALETQ
jgi:acetyltransferase-like isoleucine patch superfamily enzyme